MLKLLIIADDFTGALDTGVHYAERGAVTKIVVKKEPDFHKVIEQGVEVLVLNVESRHLDAGKAYEIVYDIVSKAQKAGISLIYKKTDSGLRGNIDSELTAMLEASGETFLPFIPAFPEMNRVTVGGVQYVDGLKLEDSIYGRDPFEPSRVSYIPDLFQSSRVRARVFSEEQWPDGQTRLQTPVVGIFDAQTQEDLEQIANRLMKENRLTIAAGCSGFASALVDVLGLGRKEKRSYELPARLFVACGSVNAISREQLDFAQEHGFCRMTIHPEKHLKEGYLESEAGRKWLDRLRYYYKKEKCCILDTATENIKGSSEKQNIQLTRAQVGNLVGKVMKSLLECDVDNTILIVGGDTLLEFFECMDCDEIIPVSELKPGLVLSRMCLKSKQRWVISKSGGFGNRELLVELSEKICKDTGKKLGGEELTGSGTYGEGQENGQRADGTAFFTQIICAATAHREG